MTDEDDEFDRIQREIAMRQTNCKHRWEEAAFGKRYWAPGTWMYQCKRCNSMRVTVLTTEERK